MIGDIKNKTKKIKEEGKKGHRKHEIFICDDK